MRTRFNENDEMVTVFEDFEKEFDPAVIAKALEVHHTGLLIHSDSEKLDRYNERELSKIREQRENTYAETEKIKEERERIHDETEKLKEEYKIRSSDNFKEIMGGVLAFLGVLATMIDKRTANNDVANQSPPQE